MKQIESLLLQLKHTDFDRVISELNEEKLGSIFYYAIDTYDLLNYCFPFGIRKREIQERGKLNIDIIADEQYTLFQLFNNNKTKVFLLDEYVKEVVDTKRYIEQLLRSGIKIINSLKKYEERFYSLGAIEPFNESGLEDIIKTQLSLVLSTAIGINHDGIDKLIDLFKTKRITLNGEELEISDQNKILIESFEEAFNIESNKEIMYILKKVSEEIEKENKELKSSFPSYDNDASVIDRINKVNELLEIQYLNNKLSNRIIILYLSSTFNSNRVFNDYHLQKYFPQINGKSLNPHRNISILFLKSLCIDSANIDQSIKNVEYLKDRILNLEEYRKSITKSSSKTDIDYVLRERFNYYRENFENYAILSKYQEYRNMVEEAIIKFNSQKEFSKFSTIIIPVLQKLIESGEKEIIRNIEKQSIFENWGNQIKFVYYFNKAIENVHNGISQLKLITGKDPINGMIHHLPIIYYFSEISYSDIILKITKFITEFNINVEENDLLNITKETFNKVIQLKPSLEERLLKAFILLLIPKIQGIENTNELAFHWTHAILENEIEKASNRSDIKPIEKDYRYFIGWVSRRCGQYEFSCRLFDDSIILFSDDARFYHGRSLSKYCLYETDSRKTSTEIKIKLIKESITDAEKAYQLYDSQNNNFVILKTQYTLLNTLSYLYTELSRITNNDQSILYSSKAMALLDELRLKEIDFQFYPEYLHTSCYLIQLIISRKISELNIDTKNLDLINEILNLYAKSLKEIEGAVSLSKERSSFRCYEKYKQFQLTILNEREKFIEKFQI